MTFERPSADFDPYTAAYAKLASLVGQLEPMRRRLVQVPFGLDHPYWSKSATKESAAPTAARPERNRSPAKKR